MAKKDRRPEAEEGAVQRDELQAAASETAPARPSALEAKPQSDHITINQDEVSLSWAKSRWYFGEWEDLASIDLHRLGDSPEAGTLAALKATGHAQLGNSEHAKKYARAARELGCDNRLLAQLLIAGVHNSLGRAAAITQDDMRTRQHFRAAIDAGDIDTDAKLALHARSVRELTHLGLLPQAAAILDDEIKALDAMPRRPHEQEALVKMLSSELELVNQQLAQAQRRKQLYSSNATATPEREKSIQAQLKELSVSQLGQDLWVLEKTGYKRNGYFVDFGATDGILLSNSLLLETQFGWEGICAEPNPKYYEQLKRNRNCNVCDTCVSATTGETVEFILANEFGGMREYADLDLHAERRQAYEQAGDVVQMVTVSLNDLLEQHNAPHDIDYLSIDTEGSESAILHAFPFDRWNITCITVEHNWSEQREEVRELLEANGYLRQEADWEDWYFKPSAGKTTQ